MPRFCTPTTPVPAGYATYKIRVPDDSPWRAAVLTVFQQLVDAYNWEQCGLLDADATVDILRPLVFEAQEKILVPDLTCADISFTLDAMTGHLIFSCAGVDIDLGNVIGATGATGPAGALALFEDLTFTQTATTVETDLSTFTITAEQLATNKDKIVVRWAILGSSGNVSRTTRVYVNGTSILDTGLINGINMSIDIELTLMRSNSSNVRFDCRLISGNTNLTPKVSVGNVNFTAGLSIPVKVTGQAASGASGAMTLYSAFVYKINAA